MAKAKFPAKDKCSECGAEILVQIMKNSGVCSENCRKVRDGEEERPNALVDAGVTALVNQPNGEVNIRGIR